MELPAKVLLHNQLLGLKGGKGDLLAIAEHGYYEVKIIFGGNTHRVLLPITETVVIFREPEQEFAVEAEIER